jgi:hypothetical protein
LLLPHRVNELITFTTLKNYYQILGVGYSATDQEIKQAYRRLAVLYHPDKNAAPEAEALFKEINEAYDTLSDPVKKRNYDWTLSNPLGELLQQPEPPKHRDPAYRRTRPHAAPRKRVNETHALMKHYLPYMLWICWAGLFITGLLVIDLVVPKKTQTERLAGVETVRGRKNVVVYFRLHTEEGSSIKFYDHTVYVFARAGTLHVTKTRIYGTIMKVTDEQHQHELTMGYIYHNLVFMPLILLTTSVLGIIFRKGIEFPFNLSIVSFIFIIINLVLLF